jgi:hypothetical protein
LAAVAPKLKIEGTVGMVLAHPSEAETDRAIILHQLQIVRCPHRIGLLVLERLFLGPTIELIVLVFRTASLLPEFNIDAGQWFLFDAFYALASHPNLARSLGRLEAGRTKPLVHMRGGFRLPSKLQKPVSNCAVRTFVSFLF